MRLRTLETRAPAFAIATFVRRRGAAYSGELLDQFLLSESTLRRRRPELQRLGVRFVENGRGSLYVAGLGGIGDTAAAYPASGEYRRTEIGA